MIYFSVAACCFNRPILEDRSDTMGLGAGGASRLAAEGCTSTGATMSVTPRCCSCAGGGGGHCVVVNVYVNNNVQGVTNSVLVGSKVAMRDPGARVAMTRRPRRGGGRRRKVETNRIGILAVVLMCVCVAAAAAAVICLNHFARDLASLHDEGGG
ncbi:hypothetical protein BS78_08G036500 [Paspalum vaginatum]|nr:hypothetical protein BS78_08G036500 [Paspalum vaginatum]